MASHFDIWSTLGALAAYAASATAISIILILALRPLLLRHALTQPNARSSHHEPTPQGGGIAVIAATIFVVTTASLVTPGLADGGFRLMIVLAATVGLAIIGASDDMRPMEVIPRLLLQAVAVAVVVAVLPDDLRIISTLPWWFERAIIALALLWFVNLVNFMDGIDWMTVAEVVPITLGLTFFGLMGELPLNATLVALTLCGATIGFAPFNRPIARLFLGDVGSLPIGLLLGWLLILFAGAGHVAAALLLPLYYVADTAITLVRRLIMGRKITQAHRDHFYQRAMDAGLGTYQIVGRVFAANMVLVALAGLTLLNRSLAPQVLLLAIGCALVGALLWRFASVSR